MLSEDSAPSHSVYAALWHRQLRRSKETNHRQSKPNPAGIVKPDRRGRTICRLLYLTYHSAAKSARTVDYLASRVQWKSCVGGNAVNGKLGKAPRANRHHALNLLKDPFCEQDARTAQQQAMLLKQSRRDDQVRHAGFVFERDEEKALGGGGTLADDHNACDPDPGPVTGARQIGGAQDSTRPQLGPQPGHQVRSGGKAGGGVIGAGLFNGQHRGQRRRHRLRLDARQQALRITLDRCGLPQRLAPAVAEGRKRSRIG